MISQLQSLKFRLLHGWHLMRWLRLGLGILIAYESFRSRDWFLGALSLVLIFQGILNFGCASGSCFVPQQTSKKES